MTQNVLEEDKLDPRDVSIQQVMEQIKSSLTREHVETLEIMGREMRDNPTLAFEYLVHQHNNLSRLFGQLCNAMGLSIVEKKEDKGALN